MAKNDKSVEFTFDTSGFEVAIKKMVDTMDTFKTEMIAKTTETNDGMMKKIFTGNLLATQISNMISTIFSSVRNTIKEFIPELSQAFTVGRDIMFKNFFWPLRRELLPYLQKFLDWVTQNRKMFLEWGNVLVNVFRVAKQAFMSFITVVKPITDFLLNMLKRIFGDTSQSIVDIINLVLFKIVSLIITIELLLTSAEDGISNTFKKIKNNIFAVKDAMVDLFKLIKDSEFGKALDRFYDKVGKPLMLTGLKVSLEALTGIINGLIKASEFLLKTPIIFLKSLMTALMQIFEFAIKNMETFASRYIDLWTKILNIASAIDLSKQRENITEKTLSKVEKQKEYNKANPSSDVAKIISSKTSINNVSQLPTNISINIDGVHLHTTEGDAKKTGELFFEGIEGRIRRVFQNNLLSEGKR
jgi:hypothetical protein